MGFVCRTVEEFKKGHPENSLNVPYLFFTPDGVYAHAFDITSAFATLASDLTFFFFLFVSCRKGKEPRFCGTGECRLR